MAVETLKSDARTNDTASPAFANTAGRGAPDLHKSVSAVVTVSASASSTSTYELFRVPSNAVPKGLYFTAADLASGKCRVGLYALEDDGTLGAVVDDNHLGHIDFGEGPHTRTNRLYQDSAHGVAGTVIISDQNKPLWETLGLASDPNVEYVVLLDAFEAFPGSATEVLVELEYAV